MLGAVNIRMEYLKNPVGLDHMPWFGWVLESSRNNVTQQVYQLQVAQDEAFGSMVYDSGWVESEESVHVTCLPRCVCPAPEYLSSCTRYYVRVRVRDGVEESGFGDTSSFVTGIVQTESVERKTVQTRTVQTRTVQTKTKQIPEGMQGNGDGQMLSGGWSWKARFITAETQQDRDRSGSTCLTRDITVKGAVAEAYVCATALGLYHFYINGKKAGKGQLSPGWTSYHKHLCYQTIDVTGLLKEGKNALGAMIGAGWFKGEMGFLHQRCNYGEQTAFFMQMVIRYQDGREEWIVTDDTWSGNNGPVTFSEIYDGEIYDARLEEMEQKIPVSYVDFPLSSLTAQAGSLVETMDCLPAAGLIRTPNGDTVVDFGQNLTGRVEIRVKGKRGECVRLKCFETLDKEGNVYTANLRKAKQELTYICRGKAGRAVPDADCDMESREEYEIYSPFFTFQGFRYIQILSWPGTPDLAEFCALPMHSQMENTGTFACSNPLVNQLQHNILWGLKGNFLDIPTDCPQRDERMGWTGDAQIFCRTACYLTNAYTFFRKWLKDVAADQTPEGGVPHVVPDIITGKEESDWLLSQGTHSAAAWADVAVINPWTLYLIYGDRVILEEQYESMKNWVGFMREHAVDDIWNYRLQFGDWVALDAQEGSYFGATPNDLTCTAYYAWSTGLFAKIAGILHRDEDASEYTALYERIVRKFQTTFFCADGSMTSMTQTAHIIALYFQLVPQQFRMKTAAKLKELLDHENGHLVTGFVGTPYFCHALSRNGYGKEAYELLLKEDFPSWLYQVKMGATTVWEHWDGLKPDGTMWSPDMNSFNHYAYGAVGEWLYRVVLGIEVDEKAPGYKHSIISPLTNAAFTWAEGAYESLYGRIAVRWSREALPTHASVQLHITIPHNTTAAIVLEDGAIRPEAEGLIFTQKDGRFTAECGSGSRIIRYEVKD